MENTELPLTAGDVQAVVVETIARQMDRDPSEITPNNHLVADLGMDSLDVVELQMELEDKFELTIPDEDAEKLTTVGQIVAYITERSRPAVTDSTLSAAALARELEHRRACRSAP